MLLRASVERRSFNPEPLGHLPEFSNVYQNISYNTLNTFQYIVPTSYCNIYMHFNQVAPHRLTQGSLATPATVDVHPNVHVQLQNRDVVIKSLDLAGEPWGRLLPLKLYSILCLSILFYFSFFIQIFRKYLVHCVTSVTKA